MRELLDVLMDDFWYFDKEYRLDQYGGELLGEKLCRDIKQDL